VRSIAETDGTARIALVGANAHEVRTIMVEGDCGLLSIAPPELRPVFEPSLRKISWPNGAEAMLYSAAEPDHLRGPQHSHAWCDEIAKWAKGTDVWNMLGMTMRKGETPRITVTTTPRQVPVMRRIAQEAGLVLTTGRMVDNRLNLSASYIHGMKTTHEGTRLGRQELDGIEVADVEGSLFPRDLIDRCFAASVPLPYGRVVVGVDPPASASGDACGIVVVGTGADGKAYVLADCTVEQPSPERWARAVAAAYHAWGADKVVAEGNQGGEMVTATLRAAELGLPVKLVHASRGKSARAEPVAMLFEAGRAWFAGAFPELEDELAGLQIGGGYEGPGRSPDRADACVWAMTELMLGKRAVEPRVRGF
jgi:phage terminase large subunit-like protein